MQLSNFFQSNPFANRNLLTLLFLGFLFLSVPLTVYLVINSRDDRSKAEVPNQPDIDVIFIERTPRYQRYDVRYGTGYPLLAAGTESLQRKPNPGQTVTFTAHYKNAGNAAFGSFRYKWFIDGVEVKSDFAPFLLIGGRGTQTLTWPWQDGDHTVKFVVDTDNTIVEISENNNSIEDRTNAIYLRMQVEQSTYDNFNSLANLVGSYSFEDWVQAHMKALNQKLIDSGSIERVRIDQIHVQPNDTLPNCCTHADVNWDWDGSWGFSWAPDSWCMPGFCNTTGDRNDITFWITRLQPGLIHEWTHQMGMAHSYDANVDIAADNQITGKRLIQTRPEIVGAKGGDDVGWAFVDDINLTPYFVKALNTNKDKRRGYYADYLFDIPDTNKLVFKDALGNLLTNAQIKIWQTAARKISGSPRFTGTTNTFGEFVLPNQTLPFGTLTTSTGHTMKANPFGIVHVVGENGLFLIEVTSGTQKDYKILTVHEFNMAYWAGQTTSANYVFNTEIVLNGNPDNIAFGKVATASKTSSQAIGGVDGDKTSVFSGYWEPAGGSAPGDWWQVDLGQNYTIYKMIVYSGARNNHDWMPSYEILASTTGAFGGEERIVAVESDWDLSRAGGQTVTYLTGAVDARYLRIKSTSSFAFTRLQEFEVFSLFPAKPGDINRDGQVNSGDLAILISTWGSTTDLRADVNGDSRISSADLARIISLWGS